MSNQTISPDFPFTSHYVEVLGSNIHYIDEGKGDPIVFVHGNPTSNYLWRNVIPHLTAHGRCIAPDLIGMGKSDKPDIAYGFNDAYRYLEQFIEQLELTNVTLVLHDWGSALGFHYANLHRNNIKAIAFMEAMYDVPSMDNVPLKTKVAVQMMRNRLFGRFLGLDLNIFIRKVLPDMVVRSLTKEELAHYAAPYPTRKSRVPLLAFPLDGPIDDKRPTPVTPAVRSWAPWLASSKIPKLCLYATPGVAIQEEDVDKIRRSFVNTELVHIGEGLHFVQEDRPDEVGEALSKWYSSLGAFGNEQ
ncbi:MAG: haloalkane dehalogenase [Actinomycetota bacterium]